MQCDWLVELEQRSTLRRLRAADAICGCSNHVAEGVARRFPELAERCHSILNASNPERFFESDGMRKRAAALRAKLGIEGQTVILFVGRVCPEKGVHVLVEAMHRVRQQRDDAVLLVAGAFSQQPPSPLWLRHRDEQFGEFEALKQNYRSHLEEAARGIEDRVHFLGKVPHEDLPDYYGLADIFVHPAIWQEPFGMILTEAMGCGLPVVSTRSGGIPEIVVDGETGLLARTGDPETLADAILDLAGDPVRRKEMGKRGAERLRDNFTWERTASRMEDVLLAGEPCGFTGGVTRPENRAGFLGEPDE
jgi:glycosyltransferase involved in cell wall biosynthesis